MKIALIALAVSGSSLVLGLPAMAADSVSVTTTTSTGPGGIAFGYSDGYWDQAHTWHAWENQQAMTTYRTTNHEHYYEYKHDRDPDAGWREHERYWDKH
jgi:hypothetical protein